MPKYKIVWDDGREEDGILILKRQLMNMLFIFKDAQEKALKSFICLTQEIMITMRKILSIQSIR